MKHKFRMIIGMLLLAIPLCMNAQVKPVKVNQQDKNEVNPKENVEKPEKPEKPKGGLEMPKISGFVQGMYQANLTDEGKLSDNTFSMRRVRMSIEGNLAKGLSYKIQGDFTRKPMLVDAFVKYKVSPAFAIQLGQFKTPFSIESPINPVNLEIFDYGEIIQALVGYKDVCGVGSLGRDLGIMATGSLLPVETRNGDKFGLVDYSIGVFNGNGANEKDNNNRKDIVGRLDIHPWVKTLTLSGSYYYGKYYKDEAYNGVRNRWAAGLQYNDNKFLLRSEFISGATGYVHDYLDNPSFPVIYNCSGLYAVTGYNFEFGKEGKMQKLMPVIRYEQFSNSIADYKSKWYTIGINYWPVKSLNFKLDYSFITKTDHATQPIPIRLTTNSHRLVGILSYKF